MSLKGWRRIPAGALALGVVACGAAQAPLPEPAPAEPARSEPAPPAQSPSAPPAPEPAEATPTSSPQPEAGEVAEQSSALAASPTGAENSSALVAEECASLCRQATEQCSSRSARRCRANCDHYQSISERCGDEVLRALRCQASVPGLICSNLVGQCSSDFERLSACETGVPKEPTASTAARPVPSGWQLLEDETAGFSIALPKLMPPGYEDGNRTWRVEDGSGATYVVAVLPPFQTEIDDKSIVRKVLVILGQHCQRNMKIHGRFESGGRVAVRFDSECKDEREWHGMLRISERHVILTAEIVPPGRTGKGDAFYYSFAYLG